MHADAGNFARRKESWNDVAARIGKHLSFKIRWYAAHGVVRRWLHRDWLTDRLHALIDTRKVGDVGQLLFDDLATKMTHVEMDEVLAADTTAGANLLIDRARDHVAWRELHQLRRVRLHETLPLAVEEIAALAARRLAQQNANANDAGWVELIELHVLQRHTVAPGQRHAVTSE